MGPETLLVGLLLAQPRPTAGRKGVEEGGKPGLEMVGVETDDDTDAVSLMLVLEVESAGMGGKTTAVVVTVTLWNAVFGSCEFQLRVTPVGLLLVFADSKRDGVTCRVTG